MIEVNLTVEDYLRAGDVGVSRHKNARSRGLTPRTRVPTWQEEIDSAGAELAVSLAVGLPWTGEGWLWAPDDKVPPPDVGERIEVRWTANQRRPRLRFYPRRDDLDAFYFLVTGTTPTYYVHGWLRGAQVMELGEEVTYPNGTIFEAKLDSLVQLHPEVALAA